MKVFHIWMEGFNITGDGGPAQMVGTALGTDFRDAVNRYYAGHPDPNFDAEKLSVWGCRLFDNETDARKSFG